MSQQQQLIIPDSQPSVMELTTTPPPSLADMMVMNHRLLDQMVSLTSAMKNHMEARETTLIQQIRHELTGFLRTVDERVDERLSQVEADQKQRTDPQQAIFHEEHNVLRLVIEWLLRVGPDTLNETRTAPFFLPMEVHGQDVVVFNLRHIKKIGWFKEEYADMLGSLRGLVGAFKKSCKELFGESLIRVTSREMEVLESYWPTIFRPLSVQKYTPLDRASVIVVPFDALLALMKRVKTHSRHPIADQATLCQTGLSFLPVTRQQLPRQQGPGVVIGRGGAKKEYPNVPDLSATSKMKTRRNDIIPLMYVRPDQQLAYFKEHLELWRTEVTKHGDFQTWMARRLYEGLPRSQEWLAQPVFQRLVTRVRTEVLDQPGDVPVQTHIGLKWQVVDEHYSFIWSTEPLPRAPQPYLALLAELLEDTPETLQTAFQTTSPKRVRDTTEQKQVVPVPPTTPTQKKRRRPVAPPAPIKEKKTPKRHRSPPLPALQPPPELTPPTKTVPLPTLEELEPTQVDPAPEEEAFLDSLSFVDQINASRPLTPCDLGTDWL